MRSIAALVLFVVPAALGSGCSDSPLVAPTPIASPPPPVLTASAPTRSVAAPFVTKSATVTAAQSGSALAQLAISTAFVKVHDHTDSSGHVTYMYVSWFRIAETSGASGATVSTIRFSASGVGEVWSAPFRIGTAEVSDHVTNLQANNNNYPAVITQSPVDFITVTLTFVDDRGTPGTLTARLDIN